MSGNNYSNDRVYTGRSYAETSGEERIRAASERSKRLDRAREDVTKKATAPRPVADHSHKIDSSKVRDKITRPAAGIKRVYIIDVDNSGSNEMIASHFRKSSEYFRVNVKLIDPEAQFAFVYFSDHMDRERYWQAVDYFSPDEEGEKILLSTINQIEGADGDDLAEAHECVLLENSKFDFGSATERHLIMVSDVAGHGMGMDSDKGCKFQQDWEESVKAVYDKYSTFEFIGCGGNRSVGEIQKQFIKLLHPELVAQNFIDLSNIRESADRLGIVLNTVLFLVARNRGIQSLEAFLGRLYEKWLNEPIFGDKTDSRAKEAIVRFMEFVPGQQDEKIEMITRILSVRREEAEQLLKRGAYYI